MLDDPQPTLVVEDTEEGSRLTAFFRPILAIPHFVVALLWAIAAFFAVVIAWFALLITARYPAGLYRFVGNAQRYFAAVAGYASLATDVYPRFGVPGAEYPVRLEIPVAKDSYDRSRAGFRLFLGFHSLIILNGLSNVLGAGACMNWFAIVFTGRRSRDARVLTFLGLSYQARSGVFWSLMTEQNPPVKNPPPEAVATGVERPTR